MATLLNGTNTNRLVEVLAGSTALLNDTNGGSALPLSLNALLGDDTASADVAANAAAPAATDTGPLVTAGLLDPVTDIVDGALGTDTSNLLGIGDVLNLGTPSQLALAGEEGGAQPVFDAANSAIRELHIQMLDLGEDVGIPQIMREIKEVGTTVGLQHIGTTSPADDGHSNLVTDIVNLPNTLLHGGLDNVITEIGGDLNDILVSVGGLVNEVLNGSDPLNPISGLIDHLGLDLQTLPLLNINGGDSADGGGLLGGLGGGLLNGVVGDLTGSSSGHLIDIDLGPANNNGLGLDLLATPDATHSASINVLDVGPNGPHLLDLGVLTNGGLLDLGGSGDAGTGGVAGNLLGGTGLLGGLLGGAGSEGGLLAGAGIIDIPGLGGADADGLTGNLLGPDGLVGGLLGGHALGGGLLNGDIASGNTTSAPVTAPLDIAALTDITAQLTGDHGILDLHSAHIL